MFTLDERLALCASFVREGTKLADIGTDHAYLPVWLAAEGKIKSAVASDVRLGPLENAKANINKYHAEDKVSAKLSDGLDNISSSEAEDIVIAGMGGELIVKIISRTDWLKSPEKRLILQPMTKAEYLRRYLCENGYKIEKEKACISCGKTYSVMLCRYDEEKRNCSIEYSYIGSLCEDNSYESKRYIYTVKEKLKKMLNGYNNDSDEYKILSELIYKFGKITNREE